jgi:hypothetical protein
MEGSEFIVGSLNILDGGVKVSSKDTLTRKNGSIGLGNTDMSGISGNGNIIIGDDATVSPSANNRIVLGNGVFSTRDNSIFTISGLSPVVGIPSMLMYDNTTGQIGPCVSSIWHKKNVKPVGHSLSRKIFKLHPRTYMFREDEKKEKCIGLVAEDVNKNIPQLVVKTNGRPTGVRYDLLSVLLLNEMKRMRYRNKTRY